MTTSRVKNGALETVDLSARARAALRGATGAAGTAGAKGETGATGPAGPSLSAHKTVNAPGTGTALTNSGSTVIRSDVLTVAFRAGTVINGTVTVDTVSDDNNPSQGLRAGCQAELRNEATNQTVDAGHNHLHDIDNPQTMLSLPVTGGLDVEPGAYTAAIRCTESLNDNINFETADLAVVVTGR